MRWLFFWFLTGCNSVSSLSTRAEGSHGGALPCAWMSMRNRLDYQLYSVYDMGWAPCCGYLARPTGRQTNERVLVIFMITLGSPHARCTCAPWGCNQGNGSSLGATGSPHTRCTCAPWGCTTRTMHVCPMGVHRTCGAPSAKRSRVDPHHVDPCLKRASCYLARPTGRQTTRAAVSSAAGITRP